MATAVIMTAILAGVALFFLMRNEEEKKQDPRTLYLGSIENAELIYDNMHLKSAQKLIKREDTVQIETIEKNVVIAAILVELLEGKGKSFIQKGGVGERNADIILRSEWGMGYTFRVRVYGKKKEFVKKVKINERHEV